jgi:hypothetical protein
VCVLVVLAACGGGDGEAPPAAGREVVAPGLSRIARSLVGRTEVLMLDMETRAVVVIRAEHGDGEGTLSLHEVPPVPGDGPIVEVSGVQGEDGTWVVAGTNCWSIEVYGADECDPGEPTIAVLADGAWSTVEAPPPALTGAAVSLRGVAGGTALLEGGRGREVDAFWVLDVADARLEQVPWVPHPLGVEGQDGAAGLIPERSTCLAGDRLVTVEGRTSTDGQRLDTRVVVVALGDRSGEPLVDVPVDLGDGQIPHQLLCDVDGGAGSVQLIGSDRTGHPAAYEVDIDTGFVAGAVGPGAERTGPAGGTQFGPAAAVFSYGAEGPTTFTSVPGEEDAIAARTTPGTLEAVHWAAGRWSHIGPEAGFDTDDRLLPVAGTVVAYRPVTGRFRLPEA